MFHQRQIRLGVYRVGCKSPTERAKVHTAFSMEQHYNGDGNGKGEVKAVSTEVPDGATQRHSRMMDLLAFINLRGKATITQIQAYMMTSHGLKFKTTSEMIHELTLAGIIKEDGHGFWYLTEKQQAAFQKMQAQQKKEKQLTTIARRISKIKNSKARKKALRLYEQLLEILPEE